MQRSGAWWLGVSRREPGGRAHRDAEGGVIGGGHAIGRGLVVPDRRRRVLRRSAGLCGVAEGDLLPFGVVWRHAWAKRAGAAMPSDEWGRWWL